MFGSQRKTTLIVCISFLAVTIAVTAFAETIGQKTVRLRREAANKKDDSTYSRGKYTRGTKDTKTADKPKETVVEEPVEVVAEEPEEVVVETSEEVAVEPEKPVVPVEVAAIVSTDVLDLVPADSLVCIRVNNFGSSLSRLDQYLTGISPLPLSMMVTPQIGMIFGNPMQSGIDFDGNVIMFAQFKPGMRAPAVAIVLPVTKYEDFTGGNPNCSAADADGVSSIKPPKGLLGNLISIKAPGGKYAIITQPKNKSSLLEIVKSSGKSNGLAGSLTVKEQKLAQQSPLWIYGNIEKAAPLLLASLEGGLTNVYKLAQELSGKKGEKMDFQPMRDTVNQLKSLSLTLTPMQDKITLSVNLTAKKGTPIAKALVADPAAKDGFEFAGYLKDSAAINAVAKINKPLLSKLINLMMALTPADSDPAMTELNKLLVENIDAFGSEMAFSLSPGTGKSPFNFKQITSVKGKDKIQNLVQVPFGMIHKMSQSQDPPKIDHTQYAGNFIYSMKLPMPAGTPGPAIDLPKMHVAIAGDKVVSGMGSIDEMKSFIHRTSARAGKVSGDIETALRVVDNSAEMDFVASVNILRMIGIAGKTMAAVPDPGAQMVGGMLSAMQTDSKSCMVFAGKIDDGTANIQYVLPKDHLMEVMGVIMQLQMQKMQMQQMQMQQMQKNSGGKK